MRTIRASEIGTYVYCRRAWWHQKQGIPSENLSELAGGMDLHRQHGRQVLWMGLLRTLGYGLLLIALPLLVAAILWMLFG